MAKYFKERIGPRSFDRIRKDLQVNLRDVRKRVLDEQDAFAVVEAAVREARIRSLLTEIAVTLTLEVDLPADIARFRLPEAVAARLQTLLDRQDCGQPLTTEEREEAEGLVEMSEFFTLLRLRAERLNA